MKKQLQKLILLALFIGSICSVSKAQTLSDFENLTLSANSYWDGLDTPLGTSFISGNAIFPNYYDTAWGGFWESGWAYSNMKDTVTSGFFNMHSVYAGGGFNNSDNFAVGTQGSVVHLTGAAIGKVVGGFYISNTTYAALSMKDGDFSGKKFGGTTGDDPDWFKLTINAYYNNILKADSVEFYLADYRFADNQLDYIVKSWQWVDLSPLGNVDSLMFTLTSSDNGTWGMNTPAFYCVDNFTTLNSEVGIGNAAFNIPAVTIYPNPVSEALNIKTHKLSGSTLIRVYNVHGQLIIEQEAFGALVTLQTSAFSKGVYFIKIISDNFVSSQTFIKE